MRWIDMLDIISTAPEVVAPGSSLAVVAPCTTGDDQVAYNGPVIYIKHMMGIWLK